MKRKISIALIALLPTFLLISAAEIVTYVTGYQSSRDSDYQAAVEKDQTTLGTVRYSIGSVTEVVDKTKEIYFANPREELPTNQEELNQYYALFSDVIEMQEFERLTNSLQAKGPDTASEYHLVGFVDGARARFVVIASVTSGSIRNYMLPGTFFSIGEPPRRARSSSSASSAALTAVSYNAWSFNGVICRDGIRNRNFFSSAIPLSASNPDVWYMVQTDEDVVFRVSNLFRERFLPFVFTTLGLMVLSMTAFTFFLVIRPLSRLTRSSEKYVEGLKKGELNDTFAESRYAFQTEYGRLNDSLYYMQDAIKDYSVSVAASAKKEQQIAAELGFAERIQSAMVPSSALTGDDFHCCGMMVPAKEVGGDFYDYFRIDDHRIGFFIGDVSGKGVPAALFMARAHTVAKLLLGQGDIEAINRNLCEENSELIFVTAFFGVVDLKTRELSYVNCGHEQAYIRKGGTFQVLEQDPNMPLGYVDDFEFVHQKVSLEPGDAIFVYTDGLSEASDINGNLFGRFGVLEPLNECASARGSDLLQKMWGKAKEFVGDAPQSDDACMVLFELNDAK